MTDSPRFETALEISPLTVLVRGVLEWACPHAFFEELFDRECRPRPWNRQLTISALAWLMLAVVTGVRRSVFAAFVADRASGAPTILATAAALYAKYGRIDPRFTVAVVRAAGARMRALLEAAGVRETFGWEGYRVTILDGTDLAGTDHRLTPPRRINAAGLPGRYVAAYDLATGLVVDAAASEDAYTSERALVRGLLRVAVLDQLFVADRHFCTTDILFRIIDRGARFVIREHGNNLRRHPVEAARAVGRVETGAVWEQAIEAEDTTSGQRPAAADAADHPGARCAHRGRGDGGRPVEQPGAGQPAADLCPVPRPLDDRAPLRADQGGVLRGEIEGLGRPRAALFAMALAMVAANAPVVVKQALRVTHGAEEFESLSDYYLADEVVGNDRAVDKLIAASEWSGLGSRPAPAFWGWCCAVGARVKTQGFHTHPRGPKGPQPARASGRDRHHYSTYRLLKGEDP